MIETRRIKQLRALAAELSRQPASDERDALLHEIRGRIVALDVGADLARGWTAPAGSSAPRNPSSPRLAEVWPPLLLDS